MLLFYLSEVAVVFYYVVRFIKAWFGYVSVLYLFACSLIVQYICPHSKEKKNTIREMQ